MKNMRIGIFGLMRGADLIESICMNNCEIVAVCDKNEKRLEDVKNRLGNSVMYFREFDDFINHPMDAVLIANYFHEHTEFVVRALSENINVLCECLPSVTMADSVKLVRAAEKSKAVFMLMENYPYMFFNQEMKRIYSGGTLGKVLYAEGEYNHPSNPYNGDNIPLLYDSEKHWRNFLPRTYYISHSLAPLMYITGATPIKVSAVPVYSEIPDDCVRASRVPEAASIITILNDDKSVFKVTGHASFAGESNSYRFCGEKGTVENIRGTDGKIMLRYNEWDTPKGEETVKFYKPYFENEEFIKKMGHYGGDYFALKEFADCAKNNRKPDFDVYFSTFISSVAIMAHRSVLNGGIPYEIPDFRNEEDRKKYENDNLSPFYMSNGTPPDIPCTVYECGDKCDKRINNFNNALKEK